MGQGLLLGCIPYSWQVSGTAQQMHVQLVEQAHMEKNQLVCGWHPMHCTKELESAVEKPGTVRWCHHSMVPPRVYELYLLCLSICEMLVTAKGTSMAGTSWSVSLFVEAGCWAYTLSPSTTSFTRLCLRAFHANQHCAMLEFGLKIRTVQQTCTSNQPLTGNEMHIIWNMLNRLRT
jgi:hypothetical protein